MIHQKYISQADLLLRVIPHIAKEKTLALKGGTAINLFLRKMPRLSVDIDLTYLPFDKRDIALSNISESLERIKESIQKFIPGIKVSNHSVKGNEVKLILQSESAQVKIEVNTITRGHLYPERVLQINETVQKKFQKFAAALDRQHPRDLFDVYLLFQESGFTEDVKNGFIGALVSHMRPIHEILKPHLLDQRSAFENQFEGMSAISFTYQDFETTRTRLVKEVNLSLKDKDRTFLLSFKQGNPDWQQFPIQRLHEMPAVQWKLMNIQKLKKADPEKHIEFIQKLESILYG